MNRRPVPFVLAGSDHGPMIVNRLDFAQDPSGAIYGVGHQILNFGAYDPEEVAFVKEIVSGLPANSAVLDCGANIGVHTIEMARSIPDGVVWAFEPQEPIYYALCGNIALNNLFNVRALNVALSDETGPMQAPRPDYTRPASFGSLELRFSEKTEYIGQSVSYAAKNLVSINRLRIDGLSFSAPVGFVKMDVEGMELEALRGAHSTLSRDRPILLVEWIKVGQEALSDFLVPLGYDLAARGMNLVATPK